MIREGIISVAYSESVEPRPFSRFTDDPEEIEANHQWRIRAGEWGMEHIDEFGHEATV